MITVGMLERSEGILGDAWEFLRIDFGGEAVVTLLPSPYGIVVMKSLPCVSDWSVEVVSGSVEVGEAWCLNRMNVPQIYGGIVAGLWESWLGGMSKTICVCSIRRQHARVWMDA